MRTSLHRARLCTGGGRSLNCMEWSLLPPATEEMMVQTSVVKGRFMGDPSHEYEHTELQKVKEGDKVFEEEVVVQIKEETRLVSIIDQIDKAVAIIPRGALFKTPFGPVHVNRTFEGLSLSEAKKLSSYFHFREPVELKNKTLLEKAALDPSLDFMDSLEHDIPKGWSDSTKMHLLFSSLGDKVQQVHIPALAVDQIQVLIGTWGVGTSSEEEDLHFITEKPLGEMFRQQQDLVTLSSLADKGLCPFIHGLGG
ncbi:radial spoke head protein 9 homolog isoform X4 [Pteropus medius]|uniref:radial spoke head protein 9 homolog isoform X4 n=1 Tax=Pteropus vampyrus TaxID=132908 RepID=UPI00196B58C5|nr:radial spoke head protein 9 homolog isoform X4 [Pteropus giganteus]